MYVVQLDSIAVKESSVTSIRCRTHPIFGISGNGITVGAHTVRNAMQARNTLRMLVTTSPPKCRPNLYHREQVILERAVLVQNKLLSLAEKGCDELH